MENYENNIIDWSEVRLSNDFMFGKVMAEPTRCLELLRRIFPDRGIASVQIAEKQKNLDESLHAKGVRVDMYARGNEPDGTEADYLYEMQTVNHYDIPLRMRFEHSQLDMQSLNKGLNYRKIRKAHVIFICTFDPFGMGLYRYDFRKACMQDAKFILDDRVQDVVLNAASSEPCDAVDRPLRNFLDYIMGRSVDLSDPFIRELEKAVAEARQNDEWRRQYMTLENYIQDRVDDAVKEVEKEIAKEATEKGMAKGMAKGHAEGMDTINTVYTWLDENGRLQDMRKALKDSVFRNRMIEEFKSTQQKQLV